MDAFALLGAIATLVLAVIGALAGLAVLRLVKMKELEHEMTYGEPAAAERLRLQHAQRVTRVGARQAVTQTIASLRPAPGTRPTA